MQKKLKIAVWLLMLWPLVAGAQVRFTANANKTEVGRSERFTVEFRLNADGDNFQQPPMNDFRILGGPNLSSSFHMINGKTTRRTSYSFVLSPRKTGTFTIGSATVEVKGKTYKTEPLKITVKKGSSRSSDPNDPRNIAARQSFFEPLVTKTELYQGEPLVTTYKVYYKSSIEMPEILEEPDFSGFYQDNIKLDIRGKRDEYRGQSMKSAVLKRMVLIPQKSGSLDPGNIEMRIPTNVPTRQRDFFGRRVYKKVDNIVRKQFPRLRVKPLPETGKPASFNGAVGDYKVDVQLSKTDVSVDESITLKVTISGSGNLELFELPEPDFPRAFEAYDPKYSQNIQTGIYGMKGRKTYEYLLVPRYNGTYKIPPIVFSYFNPKTEAYETFRSQKLEVTVSGGTAAPGKRSSTPSMGSDEKQQVDYLEKDILFIKTQPGEWQQPGSRYWGSTRFWYTLGGIGLLWLAALVYYLAFFSRQRDQQDIRQGRAARVSRKRLARAKKEMEQGNREAFFEALAAALWGYFADKFKIAQSTLTKDAVREKLQSRKLDQELIDKVISLMESAELARFAAIDKSDLKEDYLRAAEILTQVEKEIERKK